MKLGDILEHTKNPGCFYLLCASTQDRDIYTCVRLTGRGPHENDVTPVVCANNMLNRTISQLEEFGFVSTGINLREAFFLLKEERR